MYRADASWGVRAEASSRMAALEGPGVGAMRCIVTLEHHAARTLQVGLGHIQNEP